MAGLTSKVVALLGQSVGSVRTDVERIRSAAANVDGSDVARALTGIQNQLDTIVKAMGVNPMLQDLTVTQTDGSLIGWVGDRVTNGIAYLGAWFKSGGIGGSDVTGSQIFADTNGNVSLNVSALSRTQLYASQFPGGDIGAKVNAAYAALPSGGGEIIVDTGGSFTTPILFGTANKAVVLRSFGNATSLIYAGTTGTAVTFNNGIAFDFASSLQNITLTGPGPTTTTVGVVIGGTHGAVGFMASQFKIESFGTNVTTASNTWLMSFRQGMIRHGGTNLLLPSGLSQAGENMEFDHVTFADAPTPHTNSVWVQGGGQEVVFNSCSFDQAQLRIGNGATSAAQVVVTGCHFENPNFAVAGSVDYDYFVQDNHNGNFTRLTDCYMLQDRATAGTYTRFLDLQGGVVNIIGLGMFTPALAPLGNLARLANNVNVNLFAFNDLSGNILGSLYSGATTGFINSFPGASTSTSSGYNSIVGPGSLTGGAGVQFLKDVAIGVTAQNQNFTVHGPQTIVDAVTFAPRLQFNNGSGGTGILASGATDSFSFIDGGGVSRLEVTQDGHVKVNGVTTSGSSTDLICQLTVKDTTGTGPAIRLSDQFGIQRCVWSAGPTYAAGFFAQDGTFLGGFRQAHDFYCQNGSFNCQGQGGVTGVAGPTATITFTGGICTSIT